MTLAQEDTAPDDTPDDTVVTWWESGSAALRGTVVVLPGRGEAPGVYERFGRRLAADSYRVHALPAPSDDPDRTRRSLATVLAAADANLPRVVVGSDGGASDAARLAATGGLDGVAGLILAGLPTETTRTGETSEAAAASWDDELDARTFCSTHRARISEAGVRPGGLYAALPDEWLDADIPARLGLPVLGLHGRDDVISPVESARRWYAGVPLAELVTVTGGRHDVLNDQTHRSVAATVVLFLERLRLAGQSAEPGAALPVIVVAEPLRSNGSINGSITSGKRS